MLAFISKFFVVVRIRKELEVSSHFFLESLFFVTVGFVRWRSTVTDGCVDRTPSHKTFSRHFHPCAHITLWLKVSHDVSA